MKFTPIHQRFVRTVWIGALSLTLAIFALQGCANKEDAAATGGGKGGGKGKGKGGGGGPVPVVVAAVAQRDVPLEISVVGNVEAYSTITVRAQVGGQLTEVFFTEGDFVKKGDKLFTIDPRQLQAQLAQAQANLSRDTALLGQSQANLARDTGSESYARGQAQRYTQLAQQGIIAREQGEQLTSNADALAQGLAADRAAIESARAQIEADKANISNIQVQLGYTNITSPIDGRTGNLTAKQGNLVSPNTTDLITINQVEPIYVTFSVPEARLAEVKRFSDISKLPVIAAPQDGSGEPQRGQLSFVDNNVDMTTGTIKLKGTFTNTGHVLWPGQFVNVILRLTTRPNALVVPNQVVQTGQDGQFVYVVKNDNTVEMRAVTVGQRVDQDMVIEKGLALGDTVVVDGQLRLAPGSRIQARGANDGGGPGGGGPGGRGRRGKDGSDGAGGGGGAAGGVDSSAAATPGAEGAGKRFRGDGGAGQGGAESGGDAAPGGKNGFRGGKEGFRGGKGGKDGEGRKKREKDPQT